MNSSEKRRRQLLQQTRDLYSEKRGLPAVHPRYGAAYSELYGSEEEPLPSTFGLRAMLCFLLFALFIAMDYRGVDVANVSSDRIVQQIEYQPDIKDVWKNL